MQASDLSYQILCSETGYTAYLTIPISASKAETDPAGLIWICRADTDSSGVFFLV